MDCEIKSHYIMNKFFTALFLVFSIPCLIQAQDGYVKFNSDHKYGDNKFVFCFKGEVLPFIYSNKKDKIKIIVREDTIEQSQSSKYFNIFDSPNKSYYPYAKSFVKLIDDKLVFVDGTSISSKDTIRLISNNGNELFKLVNIRKERINKAQCGEFIRLIITNTPSIFYSVANLEVYIPPDDDGDGVLNENDSCPESKGVPENYGCPPKDSPAGFFDSIKWWYYLILLFGIGGVLGGIWVLLRKKRLNPNEVRFEGDSLNDFADKYGGLDKLSQLNPGLIPTKTEWNKMKNYANDRNSKLKTLKGKKIVIPIQERNSFGFNEGGLQEQNNTSQIFEQDITKETQLSTFGNDGNISQQLKQLENNLLREIRSAGSKSNDNSNEISRLNRQIDGLKNENNKLETERRNLDSKITQLHIEKDEIYRSLQSSNSDKNKIVSDLSQLQEKVIDVDYLIGYCESVLAYLNLCKQVTKDAYDLFYRIGQQDVEQGFAIGQLLLTFQSSINSIPLGNWMQIVLEINDSGVTSSKQIKNSFKQLDNDEEKRKQFQRLLFSEVLIKYSSTILILAEAFRNLAHFQITSELINEAENLFGKYVSELLNKVKSSGLENKYVPLFKNFEEFLGQIESVDSETSYAYNRVTGIVKDSIAEIVSYGVKTSFEETKTLIILK
jgi:hypothetical protein